MGGVRNAEATSFLGFRTSIFCCSHLSEHIFGGIGPPGEFGESLENSLDPFIQGAIVVWRGRLQRTGFVVRRDEINIVYDERVLELWVLGNCSHFDRRLAGGHSRQTVDRGEPILQTAG